MIKPSRLYPGDKITALSLSWGGAGEIPHRYQQGVKHIKENFNLEVVPAKNALRSAEWLYNNPKARAEDWMEALLDPSVKAIFTNIGGEDSIRILPYIDLNIIKNNPKIFLGFSDTTVSHFCNFKAGVVSFYGPSVLANFAESGGMHDYQIKDIQKFLFSEKPPGEIRPSNSWTSEFKSWEDENNLTIPREMQASTGWRFLQGTGIATGQLLGGCFEVMDWLRGTDFFPVIADWEGKILFLETSEEKPNPSYFKYTLRAFAAMGIFKKIKGLIFGRPYDNQYANEYDTLLVQIISEEEGLSELPIISGMDFGHTCPVFTLPIGVEAKMDMIQKKFSIIEAGVL